MVGFAATGLPPPPSLQRPSAGCKVLVDVDVDVDVDVEGRGVHRPGGVGRRTARACALGPWGSALTTADRADETAPDDGTAEPAIPARHRRHQLPSRPRRILLKLSEREYETIAAAAAEHGGLTPTGFAAEAALATARGVAMADDAAALAGDDEGLRQVLVELMQARTQLRRYGVNVNQAVAQLHGTGDLPTWLEGRVERADEAVERVDAAAAHVARLARREAR